MKVVVINSIFILLSSTVLTTSAIILMNHTDAFVQADNAATVIDSQGHQSESIGHSSFTSLNEILNRSLLGLEEASSTKPSVDNVEESKLATSTPVAIEDLTHPPENLDDAIVKITCLQSTSEYKKLISGSGFFISPRGVILTNAHVGQFLLLTGLDDFGKTSCSASTGADSAPTYEVKLLHISPTWLLKHANLINEDKPRGTGENDFALIYVTKSSDGNNINENFAYLPPATSALTKDTKDDTVILVGYPKEDAARAGKRTVATTTITALYTFNSGYADIFSLNSSPLGYTGASGGPVIDHLGRSIGVITTKEPGTTILNAITMAHIDRAIKEETGVDLVSILQSDLNRRASIFNENITPILQEILVKNIDQ